MTPRTRQMIVDMARERVNRAALLKEAAAIVTGSAGDANEDQRNHLGRIADLLTELAQDQTKQRPGLHHFKMPPEWKPVDPASIVRELDGANLHAEGTKCA